MPRTSRRALLCLAAVSAAALAAAWFWSAAAPCGAWEDRVFGAPLWGQSDPGGYYLPSAHELERFSGRLLYPGHPGLTLQAALRGLQSAWFHLSAAPGEGFSAFLARRVVPLFRASKMAAALAHVLGFWLAFGFARGLLGRERAALFAACGYSTSLPVVYFLTRVSVEPFMMAAFFLAFAAAWDCEDSLASGRDRRALVAAGVAGAAAVAGLASKFHLLWPLPAACAFQLLHDGSVPSGGRRLRRARLAALAAYAAAAAAAFALASSLLDWRDFFAYWDVGGMDGGAASGLRGLAARQLGLLADAARALGRVPLSQALPAPTRSGLFLLCEGAFLGAAACGAAVEARRRGAPRGRWLWPALVCAYTVAIWAYRSFAVAGDFHGFHYLFVLVGTAAPLFGSASDAALERLRLGGARARAAAAAAWLALINQPVLWAAASAAAFDAASYARIRALGDALAMTRGAERVAVVAPVPVDPARLLGLEVLRRTPPNRSSLIGAVSDDFVAVRGPDLPEGGGRPVAAVVELVGLDGAPRFAGPFTPQEWAARRR